MVLQVPAASVWSVPNAIFSPLQPPHSPVIRERQSVREGEKHQPPGIRYHLPGVPLCLLYNIRHLFSLSVFSSVDNIKQHGRELLSGAPGNCYMWLLPTLPTPHEDPQLVPALMLRQKRMVEFNLWVLTNAQHMNIHIS